MDNKMLDKDFVVISVPVMLSVNHDADYQEDTKRAFTSLFGFLQKNHLLIDLEPFNKDGTLKLDTELCVKNLTDEGDQLFRDGTIDGWFDYLDRSTVPNKYEKINRLEKGLAKLRENKK